jgi:hypothetical protein
MWFVSAMCDITTVDHVACSSSQQQKAVIFERNCGATTGFSTHVSVVNADQAVPNRQGNLFDIEGHPEWTDVTVRWINDHHLVITYPADRTLYKAKARWWWIKVDYKVRVN